MMQDDKGGDGGLEHPKKDDVIYEQPLTTQIQNHVKALSTLSPSPSTLRWVDWIDNTNISFVPTLCLCNQQRSPR